MKSISYFWCAAIALGLTQVLALFASAQDLPPEKAIKEWHDEVKFGEGPALCTIDISIATDPDSPKLMEGKSKAVLFSSKDLDYEWCMGEGQLLASDPGYEMFDNPSRKEPWIPFFRGGREILWVNGQPYNILKKEMLEDIGLREVTFAFGVLPPPVEWPLSRMTFFDLNNRGTDKGDGAELITFPNTRLVEWNQEKGLTKGKWVRFFKADEIGRAYKVIHFDIEGRPVYYEHGICLLEKNKYNKKGEARTEWTECNGDPRPSKVTFQWDKSPSVLGLQVEAKFTWHAPGEDQYEEYEKKLTEFAEGLPKPSRKIAGAEQPKPKD